MLIDLYMCSTLKCLQFDCKPPHFTLNPWGTFLGSCLLVENSHLSLVLLLPVHRKLLISAMGYKHVT
jgi:hypothetical protein